MFLNNRNFIVCLFILISTFLSTTALFCSELKSTDKRKTPCFLEKPTHSAVSLRTSGNSLVLPCHVANSKKSAVEWWYTDAQKTRNVKIYPVFPPVRPVVLRFVTSTAYQSKTENHTDILDASILLRNTNVDDSGFYRCVIRPWSMDPSEHTESSLANYEANLSTITYHIQSTAPRICLPHTGPLPCFTAMRTSSPTVLDAYHSAFLQCVVKNQRPSNSIFWVVGDSSVNSVVITDHLATSQHNGDQLRRIFPLSAYDYSIEITVNRTIPERVYSCVVSGETDLETTLFTYIVRTIDIESEPKVTVEVTTETIVPHDNLNPEEVQNLHEQREKDEKPNEDKSESADAEDENENEEDEETTAAV